MTFWPLPPLLWALAMLWAYYEIRDGDDGEDEFFFFITFVPALFMLLTRFLP